MGPTLVFNKMPASLITSTDPLVLVGNTPGMNPLNMKEAARQPTFGSVEGSGERPDILEVILTCWSHMILRWKPESKGFMHTFSGPGDNAYALCTPQSGMYANYPMRTQKHALDRFTACLVA
jgi:hypothetical protein